MPNSEELQFAYSSKSKEASDKQRALNEELNKRIANLETELDKESWDNLALSIHAVNVGKGFWGEPVEMDKWVAKLMLVVTEVSEVTEALRKSQGTAAVTEEFADVFIRLLDIYGVLVAASEADPYLYKVLLDKIETNRARPPKHGNRWG